MYLKLLFSTDIVGRNHYFTVGKFELYNYTIPLDKYELYELLTTHYLKETMICYKNDDKNDIMKYKIVTSD